MLDTATGPDKVMTGHDIQEAGLHDTKKEALLEIDATRYATAKEHELGFWEAVKQYPQAVFWAAIFCIAVIMAGFDAQLVTSFYALPAFQRRFGTIYEDEYIISAPWQTGLGSRYCKDICLARKLRLFLIS